MMSEEQPSLLRLIINAAEKASNIARVCRSNQELLGLLVQEKLGDDANARFEHDFKTLADVLIQETIRYDVGSKIPAMREAITGEESASFTNALGETVTITVGESEEDTSQLLAKVLHGNMAAANALAAEVHRESMDAAVELDIGSLPELPVALDYSQFGIWIDPIDATAEYITGDSIFSDFPGITSTGLDCVTVLIGVYERTTGVPVMGAISQPFNRKMGDNIYKSLIFWGVSLPELQASNCDALSERQHRLSIFSSSEDSRILQQLMELGYQFAFAAGAGHKALKVITAEADVYVLSKGSTFLWDTCAPQAILRSLGGNIYDFRASVMARQPIPLNYKAPSQQPSDAGANWRCNSGGLIAVRDVTLMQPLLEKLANV